jgi:S-DNA-T family DNA segregation ATPase FtsK/SpoIIIE
MPAKKAVSSATKVPLKSAKSPLRSNRNKGTTFRGVYTPTSGAHAKKQTPQPGIQISDDRREDALGILQIVFGLVAALSLFAENDTAITGWIAHVLRWFAGWGVWMIPIALVIMGVLTLLRNVESIPQLPFEQVAGLVLLYVNVLAFFHFFAGGSDNPYPLATAGQGGGIVGGVALRFLVVGLGEVGAFFVMCAWLLLALIFSFDLSFQQFYDAFAKAFGWVQETSTSGGVILDDLRTNLNDKIVASKTNEAEAAPFVDDCEDEPPAEGMLDDDFIPLQTKPAEITPMIPVELPAAVLPITPTPSEPIWKLPDVEKILEFSSPQIENEKVDLERARVIEETLADFGAPGHVVEILRGPAVTMFGVEPDFVENRSGNHIRVRVSKIVSLSDDLALSLAATRIRIQAPVPGRNYVGIEVPNDHKSMVRLRDVVESPSYKRIKTGLRIALGKDVSGVPVATDLTSMPHLLIAGTTGSGKSVCVNAILSCMLLNNTPDDLRLILVDPKRVEFTNYNGIPHLLAPVVVEAEKVIGALQWMLREMDARYHKFAAAGARNLEEYNVRMQMRNEKKLPKLVIVIDELADLMMLAPAETQAAITRLAQMARATGLHLVVATQRPSTDVITGLIKANFPARIAFSVATMIDSRVILDQPGAEQLLGHGDMLFQAPDAAAPVRLQGVYVSDAEIQKIIDYWRGIVLDQAEGDAAPGEPAAELPPTEMLKQVDFWADDSGKSANEDPLLDEVKELVRREGRASISMLQRRLRIGYTRSARLIDRLEELKIIGPAQGNSQTREVLDYGQTAPPEDDGA